MTGKVVDAAGQPVAGVNIDSEDLLLGGDPIVSGDTTDALGNFAVTLPGGLYDLSFKPPAPPATTHLVQTLEGIAVVGTVNVGTVVLPAGVALSGRTVTAGGLPVAGVNLDVELAATGEDLVLPGDLTDALGQFLVAVPAAPIEVSFDASGLALPLLASVAVDVTPSGPLDLGDVVLPPGFHLTGQALAGGQPVVNADLDVFDAAGDKLYTPGDNTDAGGFFDVVVPAGTLDLRICPELSDLVAPKIVPGVVVGGPLALGTVILDPGVLLSGIVTSGAGVPLENVDLDVLVAGAGTAVALCGDNTDAGGKYTVVVAPGTYDLRFEPPYAQPYGTTLTPGVAVGGPTLQDAVLPDCPFFTSYGSGTAGTGGVVPVLASSGGAPREGNPDYAYELSAGVGGGAAFLAVAFGQGLLPILGGTILLDVTSIKLTVPLALGGAPGAPGAGAASYPLPVPIDAPLLGLTVYNQFLVLDPGAPAGFAMSQGTSITFCP